MCKACGHIVYRNPVPVAVVMVTHQEKILLIQRAHSPLQGYWATPAGYIEIDETLEAGAAREVREETEYEVAIGHLIGLYSRPNTGIVFTVYQGKVIGGQPQPNKAETLDMTCFEPNELPRQQPSPVGSPEIDRWFFEVLSNLLEQHQSSHSYRSNA